jgi:hypothetical protein
MFYSMPETSTMAARSVDVGSRDLNVMKYTSHLSPCTGKFVTRLLDKQLESRSHLSLISAIYHS